MTVTVTTQAELDAAIAAGKTDIIINSPEGVWLTLCSPESSQVVAWESSQVVARGSSQVVAWESSQVVAWESSQVVARESSHVVARGSSRVVARGSSHVEAGESSHVVARESSQVVARESSHVVARGSSHVEAWESSHVVAWESSHVVAWESSQVEAWGSSQVEAWGSSQVVARESSQVVARGSSHVVAWESSHVVAAPYVAVHLHSQSVTLSGGVVIDLTRIDLADPAVWCDFHGVTVADGVATLYKATDATFTAGQSYTPVDYSPGSTPVASDWKAAPQCGNGLHLGPTTHHATAYHFGAARWVRVEVPVADIVPIPGDPAKCKVRTCQVVAEVDRWGKDMAVKP